MDDSISALRGGLLILMLLSIALFMSGFLMVRVDLKVARREGQQQAWYQRIGALFGIAYTLLSTSMMAVFITSLFGSEPNSTLLSSTPLIIIDFLPGSLALLIMAYASYMKKQSKR